MSTHNICFSEEIRKNKQKKTIFDWKKKTKNVPLISGPMDFPRMMG